MLWTDLNNGGVRSKFITERNDVRLPTSRCDNKSLWWRFAASGEDRADETISLRWHRTGPSQRTKEIIVNDGSIIGLGIKDEGRGDGDALRWWFGCLRDGNGFGWVSIFSTLRGVIDSHRCDYKKSSQDNLALASYYHRLTSPSLNPQLRER